MAFPADSALHIDRALSTASQNYKNQEYIGSKIFPRVKVDKDSDKIFLYKKGDKFLRDNTLIGDSSRAQEAYFTMDTPITFATELHGLAGFVSYAKQAKADAPLKPLVDQTNYLTEKLYFDHEHEAATVAFTSGNFATANKATPTTKWGNASSTPIADIHTAIDALVGIPKPYTAAIGLSAFRKLSTHPDILGAFQYVVEKGVAATAEQIAAYFGFDELIVGEAQKNTASRGATPSYSRIWDDHMLIFRRETGLREDMTAFGFTLEFETFQTLRWEDLSLGSGGEWVKPTWNYQIKGIDFTAGYLIYDVVA